MKASLALLAVLGLLPLAQAQMAPHTPPTPAAMAQRQVQRYTTLLSLTSEQEATATTLFTEEATTVEPLHVSERTSHKTLETAIKSADMGLIQSTATTLGTLNGEMTAVRALTEAKFYATLTSDQKTKFAAMEHGHGGGPHGEGRGGPPPADQ